MIQRSLMKLIGFRLKQMEIIASKRALLNGWALASLCVTNSHFTRCYCYCVYRCVCVCVCACEAIYTNNSNPLNAKRRLLDTLIKNWHSLIRSFAPLVFGTVFVCGSLHLDYFMVMLCERMQNVPIYNLQLHTTHSVIH